MGKISFPLENVRKDVTNYWHMHHYTNDDVERFVIPETPNKYGYYTIFLKERPDNGSMINVTSRPIIDGYEEYIGVPIDSDLNLKLNEKQFYVNYETGEILFHPEAAGDIISVDYWGKGSVVESEDINYLYQSIVDLNQNSSSTFLSFKINNLDEIKLPIQSYFPENGYLNFTWVLQNDNLKENTIKIQDITNNIVLGKNLENTGSISLPYTKIYKNEYFEIFFEISAETTDGEIIKKVARVFWDNIIYYGSFDNKPLTELDINIDNLSKSLFTDFKNYFECNNPYMIILVPTPFGEPNSIIDNITNLSIVIDDRQLIKNIVSEDNISQDYNVYLSKYKLESNTKIKVVL